MGFEILSKPNGKYGIRFYEEPEYIVSLKQYDKALPLMETDRYSLFLYVAVWSVPDVEFLKTCITAVKRFNGRVTLFVQPIDEYSEITAAGWPIAKGNRSPYWVLTKGKEVVFAADFSLHEDDFVRQLSTFTS